uniref:Putative secreted protein n=1 Tax=Nyssomyia neivai TaxID=330878 RepID=A0A1L8DNF1_9DIPT
MSTFNTWRFPMIFGSFLAFAAVGFTFRGKLFPDIEAQREKLYEEDVDGKKLIKETIEKAKNKRKTS